MSFTGKVKDGVVVLPPGLKLPDGLEVQLIVPDSATSSEETFVLHESAMPFPAVAGLPSDLAINHDYYLHGASKQEPRRGRWLRADKPAAALTQQESAEFTNKLCELAAETSNLPADLSANHDHYLHGLPKR